MKTAKLRIFNSFILSALLNIGLMFFIVWLLTPEVRLKDTSEPIEVSTIKITTKRPMPRHAPLSTRIRTKLPSARKKYVLKNDQPVSFPDLTTAFNPETELTPAKTDYVIAPDL